MKVLKKYFPVALGLITGYILYYNILSELIILFCGTNDIIYLIISAACFIISVLGSYLVINLIINKSIPKYLLNAVYVLYFCLLTLVLFGRSAFEREVVVNPLTSILDLNDWEMLSQSIMNLAVFIPAGYLFRNLSFKKEFILSITISVLIEVIQLITMRGIFDAFDIILYILGINIGYLIFRGKELNLS